MGKFYNLNTSFADIAAYTRFCRASFIEQLGKIPKLRMEDEEKLFDAFYTPGSNVDNPANAECIARLELGDCLVKEMRYRNAKAAIAGEDHNAGLWSWLNGGAFYV